MAFSHKKDLNQVFPVRSHFFDSGAFSIWTKARRYGRERGLDQWAYYETDEFYEYMDRYHRFIETYSYAIDHYANVDAIPNPELTWRNQRYLERKGLEPVPVFHYKTDFKWLDHYIRRGYPIIGIGGLVGSIRKPHCRAWVRKVFEHVCNNAKRTPCVKLHGFGITNYRMLINFPWYSVDSTSWCKLSGYGGIYVPHKRKGKYVFNETPYLVSISNGNRRGDHIAHMGRLETQIVKEWVTHVGVPFGKVKDGVVVEEGIIGNHAYRRAANLIFFEMMRASLPEYPWPFYNKHRKGFGLL